MLRRQQVLADFGELALHSDDLDEVLHEACRLVGDALGTGRAKILEIIRGGSQLIVRAGVGWSSDVVGRLIIDMNERSSETYSIEAGEPVVSQDISREDRFDIPPFMREAGVLAFVNVPILVPGGRAFGLLQVDSVEPRHFGREETQFLRTYATILGPVIDRMQKLHELRATEERFGLIVENARDYAIFIADPEDIITDWLPGAHSVFGWTEEEAVGQPGSILFTPEDRAAGEPRQEIATARAQGWAPNVRWHLRKDGSRVFIDGKVTALRRHEELIGFLKIGQDVTERRLWEAQQQTLIEELQHRTRNLIAVVRSIAQQTQDSSPDLATFGVRFADRLAALSRVQGLLSRSDIEPVELEALIRSELDALGAQLETGRIVVEGPAIILRNRAVQTLALAIHELATNARKYGALSGEEGHLRVSWRVEGFGGDEARLLVDWIERRRMPSPSTARAGGGYGRELIERALPYALDAKTRFDLTPNGLECRIDIPLAAATRVIE